MFQNVGGRMIDVRVFPIPLREDCVVRVFGIPHDLARAEAEKIGRVVRAHAAQGIEAAAAAETVKLGSVHESPVLEEDAPDHGSDHSSSSPPSRG